MSDLPGWLEPLARASGDAAATDLLRAGAPPVPESGGRRSAVLILLGEGPAGPDLLLIQRAERMRTHAGQPAFPGGAAEPGDAGPAGTALRESAEEVGLDPAGVRVVRLLPELYLPPTRFLVTPVLAWWHTPAPVGVVDPGEVARVERVPVAELVDPANRCRVRVSSGYAGPAFTVRGMLVWGFTAAVLDGLLELAGWAVPWDHGDVRPLPARARELSRRGVPAGYAGPRGGPQRDLPEADDAPAADPVPAPPAAPATSPAEPGAAAAGPDPAASAPTGAPGRTGGTGTVGA
jgi:8-oxo-dGTP pyrophosphatase MutT (NUDIX family)